MKLCSTCGPVCERTIAMATRNENPEAPGLVGRSAVDDSLDVRAPTRHVHTARDGYVSGAVGHVEVSIFESTDSDDRGDVVFRVEIDDQGSSMLPYARLTPRGVDLHIGGEAEAEAILRALVATLQKRPPKEDRHG